MESRVLEVEWEKVWGKIETKMWQEMGASNGATGSGGGERFWVSEKTEPISFQLQSNNNKQ